MKHKCPICVNSSGYTVFTRNSGNQICDDCRGTGLVSTRKFNELKKKYDDLIPDPPFVKIKGDWLTEKEKKIYDSILRNFPATKHESAVDYARQGGVRFQFIPT